MNSVGPLRTAYSHSADMLDDSSRVSYLAISPSLTSVLLVVPEAALLLKVPLSLLPATELDCQKEHS